MVHRKKNYLGVLAREYPATPKVTLERVDTWLRRYKMVNTRLNTIGATWLRGYAATHKERGIVVQSCTSTWLRGYAATWYLRSHPLSPPIAEIREITAKKLCFEYKLLFYPGDELAERGHLKSLFRPRTFYKIF